jgi:hypothetical protein
MGGRGYHCFIGAIPSRLFSLTLPLLELATRDFLYLLFLRHAHTPRFTVILNEAKPSEGSAIAHVSWISDPSLHFVSLRMTNGGVAGAEGSGRTKYNVPRGTLRKKS